MPLCFLVCLRPWVLGLVNFCLVFSRVLSSLLTCLVFVFYYYFVLSWFVFYLSLSWTLSCECHHTTAESLGVGSRCRAKAASIVKKLRWGTLVVIIVGAVGVLELVCWCWCANAGTLVLRIRMLLLWLIWSGLCSLFVHYLCLVLSWELLRSFVLVGRRECLSRIELVNSLLCLYILCVFRPLSLSSHLSCPCVLRENPRLLFIFLPSLSCALSSAILWASEKYSPTFDISLLPNGTFPCR